MHKNLEIKKIFEDSNLIVIDKPAGLVVHPGAAHEKSTVVDWLVEKYPKIKKLVWPDPERPGIVHRLDKDTSGLMILAKNPETLKNLQRTSQERKIHKSYLALVLGKFDKKQGEIISFIGRDPHHRRKQSSQTIYFDFQPGKKRSAKTHYRVLKEYRYRDTTLTLVEATLDTGRTHQIRVHFKSIGHPVIGDQTYNTKHSRVVSKALNLNHQFLHSHRLELDNKKFESKLPINLKLVLQKLT